MKLVKKNDEVVFDTANIGDSLKRNWKKIVRGAVSGAVMIGTTVFAYALGKRSNSEEESEENAGYLPEGDDSETCNNEEEYPTEMEETEDESNEEAGAE